MIWTQNFAVKSGVLPKSHVIDDTKKNFYTPNEPQLKNIIKNIFNEVIVKDFILKSTP